MDKPLDRLSVTVLEDQLKLLERTLESVEESEVLVDIPPLLKKNLYLSAKGISLHIDSIKNVLKQKAACES